MTNDITNKVKIQATEDICLMYSVWKTDIQTIQRTSINQLEKDK